MKKILLLTMCLLSGLVAADTSALDGGNDNANSRGVCYVLANQFNATAGRMDKLTRDIQGHSRIAHACNNNALKAFYTARNANHMKKRDDKIVSLTVELIELETENSKLLDAIRAHPHFLTITVTGALMRAWESLYTKKRA